MATVLRNLGMYASERMIVDALSPNPVVGVKAEKIIEYLSGKGLMASAQRYYPIELILGRTRKGDLCMLRRNDRGDHWIMPVALEPVMGMVVIADPSMPDTGRPYGSALSCTTVERFTASWEPKDVVVLVGRPGSPAARKGAERRKHFRIQPYDARPPPGQRATS